MSNLTDTNENSASSRSGSSNMLATSAREKIQGVWTSIRSIAVEEKQEGESKTDNPLESIMRTMFGACGGTADTTTGVVDAPVPYEPAAQSNSPAVGVLLKRKKDVSSRAEQAVTTILGHNRTSSHSSSSSPKTPERPVPRQFPVSSPRIDRTSLPLEEIPTSKVLPSPARNPLAAIGQEFDDGISAISANTLEEMERQEGLHRQKMLHTVRSDLTTDSSLFPSSMPSRNSDQQPGARGARLPPESPKSLSRRQRSHNSKGSRQSFNTRSTKSTATEDFERAWRRHEQQYWEDIVHEEPGEMSDSRRGLEPAKLSPNGTLTTMSSSSGFSSAPFGRHPHETLHLYPGDCVPNKMAIHSDPNRISGILESMEIGDEVGEI